MKPTKEVLNEIRNHLNKGEAFYSTLVLQLLDVIQNQNERIEKIERKMELNDNDGK